MKLLTVTTSKCKFTYSLKDLGKFWAFDFKNALKKLGKVEKSVVGTNSMKFQIGPIMKTS